MESLDREKMIRQLAVKSLSSLIHPDVAKTLMAQAKFTDTSLIIPESAVSPVLEKDENELQVLIESTSEHFTIEANGVVVTKADSIAKGDYFVRVWPRYEITLKYKGSWED